MRDRLKVAFFIAYFLLAPLAGYYWPHRAEWMTVAVLESDNVICRITLEGAPEPSENVGHELPPGSIWMVGSPMPKVNLYAPIGAKVTMTWRGN